MPKEEIHIFMGGTARRAYCNHRCEEGASDYVSPENVKDATCHTCLVQMARWNEFRESKQEETQ